jgi:K+-transporting ATPase KdpF subunit
LQLDVEPSLSREFAKSNGMAIAVLSKNRLGACDDGRCLRTCDALLFRRGLGLCPRLRLHLTGEKEIVMNPEYLIGALLSLLLTIYLIYALLRPTRF